MGYEYECEDAESYEMEQPATFCLLEIIRDEQGRPILLCDEREAMRQIEKCQTAIDSVMDATVFDAATREFNDEYVVAMEENQDFFLQQLQFRADNLLDAQQIMLWFPLPSQEVFEAICHDATDGEQTLHVWQVAADIRDRATQGVKRILEELGVDAVVRAETAILRHYWPDAHLPLHPTFQDF